jgi:hypothetical protein
MALIISILMALGIISNPSSNAPQAGIAGTNNNNQSTIQANGRKGAGWDWTDNQKKGAGWDWTDNQRKGAGWDWTDNQ